MNKFMRPIFLCLFIAALSRFSCTQPMVAGGSSSTDNGRILGSIRLESGLPASKVLVTLLPSYNNPYRDSMAHRTDTTDSAGNYSFADLAPGNYTVEAVSVGNGTRTAVYGIAVDSTTTFAPLASIAPPGALNIKAPMDTTAALRYVYVPGTSLYAIVRNGFGFIDSVAPGIIPSVQYVNTSQPAESRVLFVNVELASGAVKVIDDYAAWKYSKKLFLNSTAAGADVSNDVRDFPVLLRLSGSNFDFNQARPDGADLRFRKSDGAPVAYEIERWNPDAGRAEIWVKIDTIYGNDSAHFMTMYWGNADAKAESKGAAVFDTNEGFQGVWHLGDAAGDSIHDATLNGYKGVSPDTARPQAAEGIIGNCRQFDGIKDYITMPNTRTGKLDFPQESNYTVSAWVLLDSLGNKSRLIVSKGYYQYYLRVTNFPSNSPVWEFVEFNETAKWQTSTFPAASRQWALITGVRQGTRQFLYCNGALVSDSLVGWPQKLDASRSDTDDLSIGKFPNYVNFPIMNDGYCYFKGSIDEARIDNVARGPDWIKLCYMNQRIDDRLVKFK